ncbi:DUF2905 domain-containing protein [Parvularcula oceani]|uniref:DUF2905 domain-containing protein n=1 Tax=Parvularcula oceani TaxID=1247963 RepID=UPI0004E254FB|nr:DUF2905 domain-containing protein [Parvularcula oceani]
MQKVFIIAGLLLLALGLFWPWLSQIGLGRLPGDIAIERGNTRIYVPIVTCLILSVVATILFRIFGGR